MDQPDQPITNRPRRRIPWWMHVLIATLLYVGFKYFIPTLHFQNPAINTFQQISPELAPVAAIGFLLLAARALYDNDGPGDSPPVDHEQDDE